MEANAGEYIKKYLLQSWGGISHVERKSGTGELEDLSAYINL